MRIRYGFVALLALLVSMPALAQESAAVVAAKHHFRSQATSAFSADDLADLHAADSYLDRRTGATNVYLVQRHAGIEVWGAIAPAAVLPSGKVHALAPSYQTGLATRVNTTQPQLSSGAAVSAAEAYIRGLESAAPEGPVAVTDAPGETTEPTPITFEATEPRLAYQPTEDGALRLVWVTSLTALNGPMQMMVVRVDALTGTVLAADDLVARDRWASESTASGAAAPVSLAPLAPEAATAPLMAARAGSYRVIPWPAESPNHGDFALVNDPADATASPNGWHDTGAQTFTSTRGNNVWTYVDRDDDEQPDADSDIDGGAGLTFDFVYDVTQNPRENQEAALTNLFYWGNVFHDVTYQYGFDEASGNFQVNNFGNGGAGNDAARLEVQSGAQRCNDDPTNNPNRFACYNNANFGTPSDGGAGRMQMYEWYNAQETLVVTSPASVAGSYNAAPSLFGLPGAINGGDAIAVQNAAGLPGRGCAVADVTNGPSIAGKVALIERGDCSFSSKVQTAQALGASAAIVYNNDRKGTGETGSPEDISLMAISPDDEDDITIPAIFVARSTGLRLTGASEVVVSLDKDPKRDSDLDAGVIIHEFGHGLSNRLTGGPSASGCLGNGEQMGEGWSDYYGLLLTMDNADATPRGIATYLEFEGTDGAGIRPARYSRDFSVNSLTYQDVITGAGTTLSVPHGVGTVWASVLWDMTLDLVDDLGFDRNVYDAQSSKGNQVALNLVTQGLKLQPCLPGFVSGRDAILEADTLLYNGANSDIIWAAFARRGLGVGASEGSTANPNDGTADFNAPSTARENGPNASGARLAVAGPNPVRGETTLSLSLVAPEDVTVTVVDLLGRSVQTLHEGPLAAARHTVQLDATSLAPGVYIVRAQGDTFSATQRVTVVR